MFLKKLLTITFTLLITTSLFALPGINQKLPDGNGEYLFYSDTTFQDNSIVGICHYSDDTWGLRFYKNADKKTSPIDISTYITIDPSQDHLEFTGETIQGTTDIENMADIVNYLHDIFYELTSRRSKIDLDDSTLRIKDTYDQFGGLVYMNYNSLYPIFNLEEISTLDNVPLLKLLTYGSLSSQSDRTFQDFKGFSQTKSKKGKKIKTTAEEHTLSFDSQSVKTNAAWESKMENCWTIGEVAMLSMSHFELTEEGLGYVDVITEMYLRNFLKGSDDSLPVLNESRIKKDDGRYEVETIFQKKNGERIRTFKYFRVTEEGKVSLLNLSVFEANYHANREFYKNLLKSYKE